MVLSFKGRLQQMWSKLCDELDVLDGHTQIASRAGKGRRRKAQSDMKYRIYSNNRRGGGAVGASLRIAPEFSLIVYMIAGFILKRTEIRPIMHV